MTALDEKALAKALIAAARIGHIPNADHGRDVDGIWINKADHLKIETAIRAYLTALSQSPVGGLVRILQRFVRERGAQAGIAPEERAEWQAATALLALQAENERLKRAALTEIANLGQEIEAAESKAEGFVMVPVAESKCGCRRCTKERGPVEEFTRFIVCDVCGNKRCPHATDHRHACTGSNEPGQPGSVFGDKVVKVESMGKAK